MVAITENQVFQIIHPFRSLQSFLFVHPRSAFPYRSRKTNRIFIVNQICGHCHVTKEKAPFLVNFGRIRFLG
ncbi:hypothetical protein B4135_0710 [Caldibacillus debilis]|uniref:Uncharacterized protein n=1 Tax=Caldibacillus debilis TaxID=301148 RepID=A0A150M624_9BACI|nr:hypothetical protein B4135_0710 [Caldibacillus debilis]